METSRDKVRTPDRRAAGAFRTGRDHGQRQGLARVNPKDLVAVLQQFPEPFPDWLQQPSLRFDRARFFNSRTVYYPGSGNDGQPLSVCAQAHAAHAFVYVDYGVPLTDIRDRIHGIGDTGFRGYKVEHEEEVEQSVLHPGGWIPHIEWRELREQTERHIQPFALFAVFVRDDEHDRTHGPERFAVIFLGGDGFATYDALYCQADSTPAPFLVVLQDHAFGGNHDRFGAGGLLERVATKCGVLPEWLLAGAVGDRYEPWSGYRDIGAAPRPGGMHSIPRRLFLREQTSARGRRGL